MAIISIHNLTHIKTERCNKRTINSAFYHYGELTLCNLPVMAKLNGDWIYRKDWKKTYLRKKDILEFHIAPQGGGGGSNPLQMVAILAVAAFAPYAAGTLLGLTETALAVGTGAIMMGGGMLVNTIFPPPSPKVPGVNYSENPSPTYTLQAQGNSARIGEVVPVIYGRHLIYADFAAIPYGYYENDDHYLNQLFMIGLGEYDIEKIRIEDTEIANFKEIDVQIVNPGDEITKFNHNCITAEEVSGQTLTHDDYLGPFIVNKADSQINRIDIDVVCPKGLYYANDAGGMDERSVTVIAEARKVDEDGLPITQDWIEILNETLTSNSNDAVRKTFRVDVEDARYEVRMKRTTEESSESREATTAQWGGLKGFFNHEITYPGMTLVAMKMKATDNLSNSSSRKVNFIVTRKLKTWSKVEGWSEQATPCRSLAWAIADICKAEYGGNLTDDKINLQQLAELDILLSQRGDTFNAVFDSKLALLEALERAGKAGRTLSYIQAGKIYNVRDTKPTLPCMMFSARNIIANSWNLQYLLPNEENADYAEITYFDERTWSNKTIDVVIGESAKKKKAQMTMFGITNKEQAIREAEYYLRTHKYRRRVVSFDTELEGTIPTIGSLIAVSYPVPKWGIGGQILEFDSESLTLKLSEPIEFEEGETYSIALRNKQGELEKLIGVSRTETMDNFHVKLVEHPNFDILTNPSEFEPTHYAIGKGTDQVVVYAKVNSTVPRDTYTISITATVDNDLVYD